VLRFHQILRSAFIRYSEAFPFTTKYRLNNMFVAEEAYPVFDPTKKWARPPIGGGFFFSPPVPMNSH
jgi:hypothetical protein